MCADAEDGNVPVFGPGSFQGFFLSVFAGTDCVIIISEMLNDVRAVSKVDVLEEKSRMTSIINLEPREAFPGNPTEGDLCVMGGNGDHHIYCYLNGAWVRLDPPENNIPGRE
ncbi:MAG: hypothetical protein ACYTFW_11285 [Planctomycetota bacterium]|jgi:hypothetical protein